MKRDNVRSLFEEAPKHIGRAIRQVLWADIDVDQGHVFVFGDIHVAKRVPHAETVQVKLYEPGAAVHWSEQVLAPQDDEYYVDGDGFLHWTFETVVNEKVPAIGRKTRLMLACGELQVCDESFRELRATARKVEKARRAAEEKKNKP